MLSITTSLKKKKEYSKSAEKDFFKNEAKRLMILSVFFFKIPFR